MPNASVKLTVIFSNGDRSSISHAKPHTVVTEICAIIDQYRRKQQQQREEMDIDLVSDVKPPLTVRSKIVFDKSQIPDKWSFLNV